MVKLRFGGQYSCTYLIVDSVIGGLGDKKIEEILDQFGTLRGCVVFSVQKEGEGIEIADSSRIGIFKGGSIIWVSQPVVKGQFTGIYATRDVNNDGKIEILSTWSNFNMPSRAPVEYMWITSWDGTSGSIVNATNEEGNSVLISSVNMFELFDVEGDGIYEIRAYWPSGDDEDTDWYPNDDISTRPYVTFTWSASQYDIAPSTRQVTGAAFLPANNLAVAVSCQVGRANDSLQYTYSWENSATSRQRMAMFALNEISSGFRDRALSGWRNVGTRRGVPVHGWELDLWEIIYSIEAGRSTVGLCLTSKALPSIVQFYIQGYRPFPQLDVTNPGNEELTRTDFLLNSVKGITVGPVDLPSPSVPLSYLDTISSFTTQSQSLSWIKDQSTASKYLSYFASAKASLQQENFGSARTTLQQVLQDVNADRTNKLTSEAYALIRYNTEYLLAQLPASPLPSPALISLIPSSAVAGSSGFTLAVSGSHFVSGAVVTWNGSARTTTFVSESQLRAIIPATDVAAVDSPLVGVKNPDGSQSNILRFRIIKTVSMLLDALRSQLSQLLTKGLIGDANFAKELDNGLDNAKKHLSKPDSVNCYKKVGTFQDKVNKQYLKTVDDEKKGKARDKRFVTAEGWKALYYGAQEIMDRLPSGKKK